MTTRLTRPTPWAPRPALRVKPVDAGRIRREPHRVALLQAELANCTRGYPVRLRDVDVEEGVAAEVLGGDDRSAPALTVTARHDMLWPNPNRGPTPSRGKLTPPEVHAGRADQTGDDRVLEPPPTP